MAQIVVADLTTEAGIELLMQWLSNPYVVGIFLAPPCGSASRARSIPLKRKQPGDPPAPRPLRTNDHPNGLPNLRFLDRLKISKANKLYHLTAKLVRWAVQEGCLFCVENPQFSLFWQTTFMQDVLTLMQFTTFQACRYGSTRPKRTMLAFNAEEFATLNEMCDGETASHKHDKWGLAMNGTTFATSLETAYPMKLARNIALKFVAALQRLGIQMPPETLSELSANDAAILPALRAQTGLQPRASKLPPLIATYGARIALTGFQPDLPAVEVNQKLDAPTIVATVNAPTALPKGSKLLQVVPPLLPSTCLQKGAWVSSQQLAQEEVDRIVSKCGDFDGHRSGVCSTQVWGVPWSEEAFVQQMVKFGHPATLQSCLPDVLKEAVDRYNTMDAQQRISYRACKLGFWLKRLAELRSDEKALKQSMDAEVAAVLDSKNILLWESMLKAVDYPDLGVVAELSQGSELIGCVERTGLWPSKFSPATVTVDELHKVASMERSVLHQQFAGAAPHGDEVWRKTMEEVEAGTLVGPIKLSDVPESYPLSKRFGIQQGPKLRCIDDFTRSAVNCCVQAGESPKPHTLDVFGVLCVMVMGSSDGRRRWKGRTFDLVGAYRQCAIRPSSRRYAHIAVQHPASREIFAFRMRALPFGAVRSVHSFLRASFSWWFLLVKEFLVLATNYFDDYVVLATDDETNAITSCIHMFFKLVGWDFAESGAKAPDFAEAFQALGVLVNVGALHGGLVTVGNTDSRRRELIQCLLEILKVRRLTRQEALRLRGRLQFAAGSIFGRIAKSALSVVTLHAYGNGSPRLNEKAVMSLHLHLKLLELGRPRELRPTSDNVWFLQTDASYEPSSDGVFSGIGAVLFDPTGRPVRFFSKQLTCDMVQSLNPSGKKNAIFECEFFALFCAFYVWGDVVSNALVIYTDNNAVRDALITGHTNNVVAKRILLATLGLECEKQLTPWYARVPTDSNTADGPSRLRVESLLKLGVHSCDFDVSSCWDALLALAVKWGEEQASSDIPA